MAHAFRLQGDLHDVALSRSPSSYELHHDGRRIPVALKNCGQAQHELLLGGQSLPAYVVVAGDEIYVHLDGQSHVLTHIHSLDRYARAAQGESDSVSRAPMPGSVISIPVQGGQRVARGDVLVVIESMKMETAICATFEGTVETIHVQLGQTFDRDAALVTLAAAGEVV